jgi:DNA-binding IclR family transcriptional regulator
VGTAVPGVSAVAVPVFDGSGRLVLSLTAIGPAAMFDAEPSGPVCSALRLAAEGLSVQLGWRAGGASERRG